MFNLQYYIFSQNFYVKEHRKKIDSISKKFVHTVNSKFDLK